MSKSGFCGAVLALVLVCPAAHAAPVGTPPAKPAAKKPPSAKATPRPATAPAPRLAVPARPPAEAVTPPHRDESPRGVSWGRWAMWEGLTGFGVAALTVPATMAMGHAIGKRPSNYIAAALPGILLLWVLPPAAVATAQYFLGNHLKPGSMRFHPAFWTAMGVQILTMVVAMVAGVTTREMKGASAFAAVDALIVPGTTTLMFWLTSPKRKAAPTPRAMAFPRAGGRAAVLSLAEERWLTERHRIQPTAADAVVVNVLRARF